MFQSILFPIAVKDGVFQPKMASVHFNDLRLNQIFEPIVQAEAPYKLDEFFYRPLYHPAVIQYRQAVMRDLEQDALRQILDDFSKEIYTFKETMQNLHQRLSTEANYLLKGRFLYCAEHYCQVLQALCTNIKATELQSEGLKAFRVYVTAYCESASYKAFYKKLQEVRRLFSELRYCMLIKNGTVRVRKYDGEENLSQRIVQVFEKFKQQDTAQHYTQALSEDPYAEHVEVGVLELLSKLYPEAFEALDEFVKQYSHFENEVVEQFSREVRFYISWLGYIDELKKQGLSFCYPQLGKEKETVYANQFFDVALAKKLGAQTVTNDFQLTPPERMIVVTGPNQGGKTTFARAFGQIHYLAALGLSIPGTAACLLLPQGIYTHFEREEMLSTLHGKLEDDVERLHTLLQSATAGSVVIVNEIFSSTTLKDAVDLGQRMMEAFVQKHIIGVVVTFMDELATYGPETISMMSTVCEEHPEIRTYKVIRKSPDGIAYAMTIAGRHGLTYEQLTRRLGS